MNNIFTVYLAIIMANDPRYYYSVFVNQDRTLESLSDIEYNAKIGRWAVWKKLPGAPMYDVNIGRIDYSKHTVSKETVEAYINKARQAALAELRREKYSIVICAKYQINTFENWMKECPDIAEMLVYRSSVDAINSNNIPAGPRLRVYMFERKD